MTELKPRISVIGVGGAGGNAVNNMIESQLEGVEFVVANTDAQAVGLSLAEHKVQLGTTVTQGLGAGSQPHVGSAAAEESLSEVMDIIAGSNMLFITAGMGGGTGTGAAPVIARAARERNILTVGVVTKPFHFEGARRMRIAEEGIAELQKYVDTLLIIPNQNLFRVADDNTTFADAFGMADEVLHSGVRGITDLMIVPGLINLDFADVRSVMSEMGKAMMGTGEADGDKRAAEAAEAAISNPLLDEVSMKGARGVLINITGGMDMKLFEVDEAANRIRSEVDPDANIIVGSTFSHELEGKMRVSVVATGIDAAEMKQPTPVSIEARPVAQEPAKPWLGGITATPAEPVVQEKPEPATEELFDLEPAAQETAEEIVAAPPAEQITTENPVGDVHARITRLLTEDDEEPAESLAGDVRRNPFQDQKSSLKSPLNAAMGLLKDTFGSSLTEEQTKQPPAAKPTASSAEKPKDFFKDDQDDDLEIPAFLRRRGGR